MDRQGRIKNDCLNCRKRTRKFLSVGEGDFCCLECALNYVVKLRKWIYEQQCLLDSITQALAQGLEPLLDLSNSAAEEKADAPCSVCGSTTNPPSMRVPNYCIGCANRKLLLEGK